MKWIIIFILFTINSASHADRQFNRLTLLDNNAIAHKILSLVKFFSRNTLYNSAAVIFKDPKPDSSAILCLYHYLHTKTGNASHVSDLPYLPGHLQ